jgi:hypothetical protein
MDMAKPALVFAFALLVAACGAVQGQVNLPQPTPPTQALEKWKDFPAHARPRPIIVFGLALEHIGPSGFSSEPDRKIDWGCNKFVLATDVQLSGSAPARATAGGDGGYPSIGSARAYSELMAARPRYASAAQCATSKPFVIAAVRWTTAGFHTDRGTMTMSAWRFEITEIDAYLAYAAVDRSAFWGGYITPGEGRGARLSGDGRTLKIAVANTQPGPCGFDYTAATAESDSAVAVAIKQVPHASPGEHVICDLVMRPSYMSVTLNRPLGGRVLVDEQGNAGAVCPESGDC